jgi:PAS domain S-box-containing protein
MRPLLNTANVFPLNPGIDTIVPANKISSPRQYRQTFIPYLKALFDALWTNSVDGMRMTDENGFIKSVNKSYCELVGMTEKELIDHPFTIVYASPEDQLRLFSIYQMIFRTCIAQTVFEEHALLRSGKYCGKDILSMFVDSIGGGRLLLTQIRNHTNHKESEQEL